MTDTLDRGTPATSPQATPSTPEYDPEREERHRKRNEENARLLKEQLAALLAGKPLDDLDISPTTES